MPHRRRVDEAWLAEIIHDLAQSRVPLATACAALAERGLYARHWPTMARQGSVAERILLAAGGRIFGALDIDADPPVGPRELRIIGMLADACAMRLGALRSERLLDEQLQRR